MLKISKKAFILISFVAALVIYYLGGFFHFTLLQPDSNSYIHFSEQRPVGYPLFLSIIKLLDPKFHFLPLIQLFIFNCCTLFFIKEMAIGLNKKWIYLLWIACIFNVAWWPYHFTVLSESLSIGLNFLFLGYTLRFLCRKKIFDFALLSGLAATLMLIRPINVLFVLPIALLCFLDAWRNKKINYLVIFCALAPFISIGFLGSLLYHHHHGVLKVESSLAHHVFGKAALSLTRENTTNDFERALVEKIQPAKNIISKCPSLPCSYQLSALLYDAVRYNYLPEILNEHPEWKTTINASMSQAPKRWVRTNPKPFIKHFLVDFASLWLLLDLKTTNEAHTMNAYLKIQPDLAVFNQDYILHSKGRLAILVWTIRTILFFCFMIFCLLPFYALFKEIKKQHSIGLDFLLTIGAFLMPAMVATALVQAGLARYALSYWPSLYPLLILFLYVVGCMRSPSSRTSVRSGGSSFAA